MLALYQEGKPVDLVTLQNRLQEMNVPAELCSVEFISNIIAAVPTSANVKYYSETNCTSESGAASFDPGDRGHRQ